MFQLKYLIATLIIIALPQISQAGWKDYFNDIKENLKDAPESNSISSLSDETIVNGLKQALNQGIEKSVQQLGQTNGFLNDASVKIPMPESLLKVEKGLRKIGQDKVSDQFITTMNHAAEQAVPKTTDILIKAVKNMTLKDAVNILNGEQDAATQYFKRTSTTLLNNEIKPIVNNATNSVGVTDNYKKMIDKAGFLTRYIDKDSLDIDAYITSKTIDGLFNKMAIEEKHIREDPAARTTDVLKNVFGSLTK